MRRVLILDGHCRAALEALMAFGKIGIDVDVSSENPDCLAFRSRYVKNKFLQPVASNQAFIFWLSDLESRYHYTLIIPATEVSLKEIMAIPEDHHLRIKAILPSNETLNVALNKYLTYLLACRLKLPVPKSSVIESLDTPHLAEKFPLVVKPITSKLKISDRNISLFATVINNEDERRERLKDLLPITPVLQQEYVAGKGVGVEFLYQNGKMLWCFAHERIHEMPITGGASSYRRSIAPSSQILEASVALLDELKWHGVVMLEFKIRPDGAFFLIEINPRLWGSLALAIDAGVNFPLGLLKIAAGEPTPPQPVFKKNYYSRNISLDIEWLKSNLRANHHDPLLLTRPHFQTFLELFRPLIGKESWDHFDWKDWRITAIIIQHIFKTALSQLKAKVYDRLLINKLKRRHRKFISRHTPIKNILFLCYGNICRSPYAEALAKVKYRDCDFKSSGFLNKEGRESPAHIVMEAIPMGVDLSNHRSSVISESMVAKADLILLMDLENYKAFSKTFDYALNKTTILGLFAPSSKYSIKDPYNASPGETRRVLQEISESVDGLIDWFKSRDIINRRSV